MWRSGPRAVVWRPLVEPNKTSHFQRWGVQIHITQQSMEWWHGAALKDSDSESVYKERNKARGVEKQELCGNENIPEGRQKERWGRKTTQLLFQDTCDSIETSLLTIFTGQSWDMLLENNEKRKEQRRWRSEGETRSRKRTTSWHQFTQKFVVLVPHQPKKSPNFNINKSRCLYLGCKIRLKPLKIFRSRRKRLNRSRM